MLTAQPQCLDRGQPGLSSVLSGEAGAVGGRDAGLQYLWSPLSSTPSAKPPEHLFWACCLDPQSLSPVTNTFSVSMSIFCGDV